MLAPTRPVKVTNRRYSGSRFLGVLRGLEIAQGKREITFTITTVIAQWINQVEITSSPDWIDTKLVLHLVDVDGIGVGWKCLRRMSIFLARCATARLTPLPLGIS